MFKLLYNGKIILRGTYRQCVTRRFEMRRRAACFNSLTIVPCDIDADGYTGYSL